MSFLRALFKPDAYELDRERSTRDRKVFRSTRNKHKKATYVRIPRDNYSENYHAGYPSCSTYEWMRPSGNPYTIVEYSPGDYAGIDPTTYRRNDVVLGRRAHPQPRDYHHYDVNGIEYGQRDPGYPPRSRGDFGSYDSYDRYDGRGGGGDRLSRDAARVRSGKVSGFESHDSASWSAIGSEYRTSPTRYEAASRRYGYSPPPSCSGFDDFEHSSSSSRRHRYHSPPPRYCDLSDPDRSRPSFSSRRHGYRSPLPRYSNLDGFDRSNSLSSSRRHRYRSPPPRYSDLDDYDRSDSSYGEDPSRGYSSTSGHRPRYGSQRGYGPSSGYRTREIIPGGYGGGYGSRSGHGSRRDYGHSRID